MEVDSRCDEYGEISGLAPSVIAERDDVSIKDVVKMYRNDLPSPMHMEEEIMMETTQVDNDKRSGTVVKALKVCDTDMYRNVYRLLQLFGTVAVTPVNVNVLVVL